MTRTVMLTPDQRKRVRDVPGLAERIVKRVVKVFGQIRPRGEMLLSAHYGIALAAQSFDEVVLAAKSEGGPPPTFEGYAFTKGIWTVLDDGRADGRQRARIAAGRCAAVEYLRFEHRPRREADAFATDEEMLAELGAFKAGLVVAYLRGVAGTPLATGGEDEMNDRIDAGRTAEKLQKTYEGLGPEQIELLDCETEADFKALAPKWGTSWWTLGRARNKLVKVVGARLAGQNVDASSAWDDGVWSAVRDRKRSATDPVAP
jgi:hypothetical protein